MAKFEENHQMFRKKTSSNGWFSMGSFQGTVIPKNPYPKYRWASVPGSHPPFVLNDGPKQLVPTAGSKKRRTGPRL